MKNDEYAKWQVHVKDLSEEQTADLLKKMRYWKKMPNGAGPVQEANEDDWLYDGMVRALKNKGWLSNASILRLHKSKGYKLYLQDAFAIRKQLGSLIKGGVTNVQGRTTLAYVVGHSLIFWVQRRKKIPNSASSVFMFACRSVEAIEEQFPGYIAANLFHLVIGGSSDKDIRPDKGGSRKRIARAPRG